MPGPRPRSAARPVITAFTPGLPRPDCQHWAVGRPGRCCIPHRARTGSARAPHRRPGRPTAVQPLAQCAQPSAHTAPLSRSRPRRASGLMLSHKNCGAVTTGGPGKCRQPPGPDRTLLLIRQTVLINKRVLPKNNSNSEQSNYIHDIWTVVQCDRPARPHSVTA